MDYETVITTEEAKENNSCDCCWLEFSPDHPTWSWGETVEIALTFCGRIETDSCYITAEDFLKNSKTKKFRMVLRDFTGEIIEEQEAKAESDFEYYDDKATCYFSVDRELSEKLRPGTYSLEVYLTNVIPATARTPESCILNMQLTDPDGIEIFIT